VLVDSIWGADPVIDWSALRDLYAPEVLRDEATADTARFKLAMKRFASSFPDGHVRLRGDVNGLYEREIGGAFGLTLIHLSDARIAVNRRPVTYEILPSGVGYLRCSILAELDASGNVTGSMDSLVASLHDAVAAFDAAPVSGVVVDIRDNPGGFDALAAFFGGLFYDHTELYEQASFYDDAAGQFEVLPQLTLYLEPQGSYFGGPVVCLVNAGTASSAEGVAMAIQRLPQGHVMGFYGTHGSFGLVAGESALPAGLGIQFPLGRSLDSNSVIQVDSDRTLTGGVVPDLRIPLTVETVQRKFAGAVDVELEEAQAFLTSQTPGR
jgi:carboxyl-terminal processing protease